MFSVPCLEFGMVSLGKDLLKYQIDSCYFSHQNDNVVYCNRGAKNVGSGRNQ